MSHQPQLVVIAFWTATAEFFVIQTPLVAEAYKSSVRLAVFFDAGA